MRTAKVLCPTIRIGEVEVKRSKPMPIAAAAMMLTNPSLVRIQIRGQPIKSNAISASSMVDNTSPIPLLNARNGLRVANPIVNGGAVKPLVTLTSIKTIVSTNSWLNKPSSNRKS